MQKAVQQHAENKQFT